MARSARGSALSGRVAATLLVASLLVVGFRAHRTSQLTLDHSGNAGTSPTAQELQVSRTRAGAAESPASSRDPFHYLDPTKARSEPRNPVEDEKEPTPALGALLYDTVNPQVQLRVAGEASGWMGTGAVFKGWTVEAIQPDAVTVQKQGERLVLR